MYKRQAETNGSGACFRDRRWATDVAGPPMLPPMLSPPCAAKVAAVPLTATLRVKRTGCQLTTIKENGPIGIERDRVPGDRVSSAV